ncbi:hypothetical protein ABT095_37695 [Kitasatospora sp. NPDC002227]|uniref:hypothetical protein n=1 Tax=Kitasatospora sp. NPDC002227 TaxID=3154773 RepID=UPI0033349DA4
MSVRKRSTAVVATLLSAGLASAVLVAVPAHADTVVSNGESVTSTGTLGNGAAPGGPVTRSQALQRAQDWVNNAVPYSPNSLQAPYGWWADSATGGRYREDCSGLISMAWQLPSSLITDTLPSVSTRLGSLNDLQPGDAINSAKHVVLFAGWTDSSHTVANVYTESGTAYPTRYTTYTRSYLDSLGYYGLRYNNITSGNPAPAATWKAQVFVEGGTNLFQATRESSNASWTGFGDVQAAANSIGGVHAVAAAGVDGDTQVVALGGDGRLYHAIRNADRTWKPFADMSGVTGGALTNVTQVAAVSVGTDLHILAVANGRVMHAIRHADGSWVGFGDVEGQAGQLGTVTAVAAASSQGELQVIAVADGKAYHTVRSTAQAWGQWGDVAAAAGGYSGPVSSVAMAGAGNDVQIVVTTDGGAHQYHGARFADATWQKFADLSSVLGPVTVTSVGAAGVNNEFQLAAVTSDNRVLHTIRHFDSSWDGAGAIDLTGVTGDHNGIAITGTLSN